MGGIERIVDQAAHGSAAADARRVVKLGQATAIQQRSLSGWHSAPSRIGLGCVLPRIGIDRVLLEVNDESPEGGGAVWQRTP